MGSKLGRAPTSGTRKGNGAGTGGPARGGNDLRPAFEPGVAGPAVMDNNDPVEQEYRKARIWAKRADLEKARQRRRELLDAKDHPAHFHAIKDVLDREEGPIVQKQEVKQDVTLEDNRTPIKDLIAAIPIPPEE